MDIAIIGPEKFAFQDMVCIDLALSYRSTEILSLVPEPAGGEDASIKWTSPRDLLLEVQVKGAKGIADVRSLAEYLLHYPSRKHEGSLLQRLMDENSRCALFVLTARCADQLLPITIDHPSDVFDSSRVISEDLSKSLKEELGRRVAHPPESPSKLSLNRWRDIERLSKRSVNDFEKALKKVSILDQKTAESIEVNLHSILRAERFDSLSIRGVLAHFSDILAAAKRGQSDALFPILKELRERAPTAVRPQGYHERNLEDRFENLLSKDSVLLITGPPRSGKSWTARAIAGRFQVRGFEIRRGAFVEEAQRFLTEPVGGERLYVLDDPLGSREPHIDASARLAALSGLCELIPPNRRLIVAQSEQVMLQVRAVPDVRRARVGSKSWQRIEPLTVDVAKDIWNSAARAQNISKSSIDRVVGLLEKEKGLREPGAIAYLAQTWTELHREPLDEEIILQARSDASSFAQALAERVPRVRELLMACSLATTESEAAAAAELAFIINGDEELPGLAPELQVVELFGDTSSELPPIYEIEPCFDSAQEHGLEVLQRRRVIAEQGSLFNFTHPYLRAGAQTLTTPDIPSDLKRVLRQLKRAIACPSPVTSLAASRNLRWARHALRDTDTSTVFGIAHLGLRSLFPATRDCCFEFLVEFANSLPKELKEKLPGLSENMVMELGRINTSHGVGFISGTYDWLGEVSSIEEVQPYLDAIERGDDLALDLALSRRLLQSLRRDPGALTSSAMQRFMRADEALVRAEAAELWTMLPREKDDDILELLSNDSAPGMAKALLYGLVRCWGEISLSRRKRVLGILAKQSNSLSSATILFSRLVLFNRSESYGENPPWEIFSKLMPIVIAHLPISVSFHDGRLNSVIDDASQEVSAEQLLPVIEAWADRLLQRIDSYTLDEFELSIIEPLMKSGGIEFRLPILGKLLKVRDTGAKVVFIKWLVMSWDDLENPERELLKEKLRNAGEDRNWLLASVLTRRVIPAEILEEFDYPGNLLDFPLDEIEKILGEELLSACVHVYLGWPQPLWWYGTHHSGNPHWERLIRELAREPEHPLHPAAFYEVANLDKENELAKVVEELPDASLESAFEKLLDFKISRVGDWRGQAWQKVFERAETLQRLDDFFLRINELLEGILEEPRDIILWLGKGRYSEKLLGLLPMDINAVIRARRLLDVKGMIEDEVGEKGREDLKLVMDKLMEQEMFRIRESPPRLFGSLGEVARIYEGLGAKPEYLSELEEMRKKALAVHQEVHDRFTGSPAEFQLKGWVARVD